MQKFKKVYVYWSMTDRQTDKMTYIINAHMQKELSLKISHVYLQKQPRKSHFLNCVTDWLTDGQIYKVNYIVASLLKKKISTNIGLKGCLIENFLPRLDQEKDCPLFISTLLWPLWSSELFLENSFYRNTSSYSSYLSICVIKTFLYILLVPKVL